MKRLSMLAALSAVMVAGVLGNNAQAQQLSGGISLLNAGTSDYPLGVRETGRYARFIMDSRLSDLNFKNRDFEAWKPLDVGSKKMMRHFIFGKLNTEITPVADQENGRYIRVIEDDRLVRNNMEFTDRDVYGYQAPSPYTAQAGSLMAKSYLRGLPVGTNNGAVLSRDKDISGSSHVLYFWQ